MTRYIMKKALLKIKLFLNSGFRYSENICRQLAMTLPKRLIIRKIHYPFYFQSVLSLNALSSNQAI